MKYAWALLLGFVSLGLGADVRQIGGRSVDIEPVARWLVTREGPRPMPHWKQVQIREIKRNTAEGHQCIVKTEASATQEVVVGNISRDVSAFFQTLSQQQATLASLRSAMAQAETQYAAAKDKFFGEFIGGAVITKSGTGGTFVDSEGARARRYYQAERNLEAAADALRRGQAEYDHSLEDAKDRTTVLAMSTGRKLGGLEVWDCGRKK